MEFLEIVRNRPLEEKPSEDPHCPLCESRDIITGGTMTTLLGCDDHPDRDINHRWTDCRCVDCGEKFTCECKSGKVWYTRDSVVLAGIANCYENYVYECAKCGGAVRRKVTALDGETEAHSFGARNVDGEWVKQYRTFYHCEDCGHGGEVEDQR